MTLHCTEGVEFSLEEFKKEGKPAMEMLKDAHFHASMMDACSSEKKILLDRVLAQFVMEGFMFLICLNNYRSVVTSI